MELTRSPSEPVARMLRTPIREDEVRRLKCGDVVYIDGLVITARDLAHRRILELLRAGKGVPFEEGFRGGVVYHSGPVLRREGDSWVVISAGPTTSSRIEELVPEVVKRLGVRVVIGKGGLGGAAARALAEAGAVYALMTGGAAVLAASAVKRVVAVEWLDLGQPEALWLLEVEGLGPLVITVDTTGRNLLEEVMRRAEERAKALLSPPRGSSSPPPSPQRGT